MYRMIVQMYRRTEVTEHATIADARERLGKIAATQNVRMVGDEVTGEIIARDRDGNDDQRVTWNYGGYLIVEVDPEALVHVVEHADGVERFDSEAEARHFQTTITPGSSRYAEPAAAQESAPFIVRTGNNGSGVTHLYPAEARAFKIHGMRVVGTGKALCGSLASSAALDQGKAHGMPENADTPCAKCAAKASA